MRLHSAALKLVLVSLAMAVLAGCNSFDCNTQLPANCPPAQTVAEDAGVPVGMQAACNACLSGAQATCVEADGVNKACSCVLPCD